VAVRVDIDRTAVGVVAPPDATEVDLLGLIGKFFGGLGSLMQGIKGGVPG
jgi:hypothetical protein